MSFERNFVRNCWYVAGWSDTFPSGRISAMKIADEPIVIYRKTDGLPVALEDRCCHRLAPLSIGQIEGNDLRCMYHGLKFDPSGKCVEIPGQERIPTKTCVTSYPIVDKYGCSWIWLGDPAAADVKLIPEFIGTNTAGWLIKSGKIEYNANYTLINDNLLDLSHITYVHRNSFGASTLGGAQWAETRPNITEIDRGVRVQRWTQRPAPLTAYPLKGALVDAWSSYDFLVPGIFLLRSEFHRPGVAAAGNWGPPSDAPLHVNFTCQAVTPFTKTTACYFFGAGFQVGAQVTDEDERQAEWGIEYAHKAFNEDRLVIEAQQKVISEAGDRPMLLLSADGAVARYNRIVERMLAAEAKPTQMPQKSLQS